MKRLSAILITIFVTISLCACSGGISGDEAKTYINDFLDAVETGDYELATTFLHPDQTENLEVYFGMLKDWHGVDFSDVEIVRYTGFSSSYYNSTVDGSIYRLRMDATVSGTSVAMEIEIVKNDNGYGIYNIEVNTTH